ncbi:DNA/RNA non-specific endonuclease [Marixanthomonas ophiurae]|uniref:Endonuclease n=1 Tax=Marixanthomonas ophiurae TaxID=387659 RepID=A0A3E1QBY6_9FLAO|nr:DNA/RNA non-specific endonuclease [Marixanthomonas ophiurae]RFN59655.1 DNA/RNA non-specific endonuclease [Marixanthomonas ophiurae]
MNRKLLYPLLVLLVTVGLYYAEKYIDKQNESYPDMTNETSETYTEFNEDYLPQSTYNAVVKHKYFTLSYAEPHEQAEWVAYELSKNQIVNNNLKRPYFVEDREVKTGSADWRNYKNSGYDRGHLIPAADREFSENAYHETFLTSNISPQNHDFNAGIWNRLEQKTRYWAKKYNGIYVVTGGVLKDGLRTIGDENVSVPEAFYKILVDVSEEKHKAIAFLIPNKATSDSFYKYVVSIDEVEVETGIDFFPKLPDSIENRLEAISSAKDWEKR